MQLQIFDFSVYYMFFHRRYMAEILPKRRKTVSKQSIFGFWTCFFQILTIGAPHAILKMQF